MTNTPEDVVQKGIRSSLIGVIVDLVLAGTKCLAGIVGHSFALVADSIESLGDVVSSSIVAGWAWWALLIGNTVAFVSAMTYDRIVNAIGPFELSEYLGLAVTAPFVAAGRPSRWTG